MRTYRLKIQSWSSVSADSSLLHIVQHVKSIAISFHNCSWAWRKAPQTAFTMQCNFTQRSCVEFHVWAACLLALPTNAHTYTRTHTNTHRQIHGLMAPVPESLSVALQSCWVHFSNGAAHESKTPCEESECGTHTLPCTQWESATGLN